MPESPRWLLSKKGRVDDAAAIISKIAHTNRKPLPNNLMERLSMINGVILNEPKYGVISLFKHWGLFVKTMLCIVTMTTNVWIYKQMLINVDNMEGSYFLNLFFLAAVEIPSSFLGLYFAVSTFIIM